MKKKPWAALVTVFAATAIGATLVTAAARSTETAPPEGLADFAAEAAANFGDPTPLSVQYAATRVEEAAPLFGLAPESLGAEADVVAYVVVMRGKFSWPEEQFRKPTAAVEPPTGEWMVFLVRRDPESGLACYDKGIGPYEPDTTVVGELAPLPLD